MKVCPFVYIQVHSITHDDDILEWYILALDIYNDDEFEWFIPFI